LRNLAATRAKSGDDEGEKSGNQSDKNRQKIRRLIWQKSGEKLARNLAGIFRLARLPI
jgi:hypothetical protein